MTTTYIRRTDGRRPPRTGGSRGGSNNYSNSRGGQGGYSSGRSFGNRGGGRPSFGGNRSGGRSGGKRGFEEMSVDLSKLINKAKPIAEEVFVPKHQFSDFAIDQRLKDNIAKKGYVTPTPIQDESIPHVLNGEDIVGM